MWSFNYQGVSNFFKTYWVYILRIVLMFILYILILTSWFILKEGDVEEDTQIFIVEIIKSPHIMAKIPITQSNELWFYSWDYSYLYNLESNHYLNTRHLGEVVPRRNLDINPLLSCVLIIFICFFNSLLIEELISDLL